MSRTDMSLDSVQRWLLATKTWLIARFGVSTALNSSTYTALTVVSDAATGTRAPAVPAGAYFGAYEMGLIQINLTSAAAASSITLKITADSSGNNVLTTEQTVNLVNGEGDATVKAAAFSFPFPQPLYTQTNETLHLWAKVDAGTPNISQVMCFWRRVAPSPVG